MRIEQKAFWEMLAKEIISPADGWKGWKDYYKEDPQWTNYMKGKVLPRITKALEYNGPGESPFEFMRLDYSFRRTNSLLPGLDWQMDLAFEYENLGTWQEELCKLSHVACGLKVLMAFHNYKSKKEGPRKILEGALEVIARHPYKTCPNRWLFIFGPTTQDPDHDFEVYEIEDGGPLTPINSAIILNPCR